MQGEVRPGYKQTDAGVIPEDWEVRELREIGVADWGNTAVTKREYRDYGFQAFSASGPDGFVSWYEHDEPGVVISAIGAQCGKTWLAKGRWTPIKNTIWFRSDEAKANVDYLFRVTGDPNFWPKSGQAQPFVAVNGVRKALVALPPTVEEQRAIAAALADADSLIAALEGMIAKKRDLKQAAMQRLLTGRTRLPGFSAEWQVKRLGDLGSFFKGRGISRNQAQSGEIPCVRYGEIYTVHHDVIRSFASRISREVAETATLLRYGDLLFAGSGETKEEIGKCVAMGTNTEAYAGGDIVILRPKVGDPFFLGYLMNTSSVVRQKANFGQGDAVVHISARALANIEVALPDPTEQTAIAEILSDMDADLAALDSRLAKARSVKQGMMQQLLTGQVRLI